jgi:2-oxoisovalerate dehydrogenase E1 component
MADLGIRGKLSGRPQARSAAARQLNRAELVDQAFLAAVRDFEGPVVPARDLITGTQMSLSAFVELFDSQMMSRHLDLMARVLRLEDKVFYTIGSSGHEGNVLLGRLTRYTDPAFLHYRSGAFMMERSRQVPGIDPIYDAALSFAASAEDPASGGRHKVWGSKPLWVLPQTSTIASHLPKALGTALAVDKAPRLTQGSPIPEDSIVLCSFGDASLNHSTTQGALNAAQWTIHQGLSLPLLFLCEDNNIGISVRTPGQWVAKSTSLRHGLKYFHADGLDLAEGYDQVRQAVDWCRSRRAPVLLHMDTIRLMGHAGTDFEVDYRSASELEACEARDPLIASARTALTMGLFTPDELLDRYQQIRERCFEAARKADLRPKLGSASEVMAPMAPYSPDKVRAEAVGADPENRMAAFGGEQALPENQPPRHLAVNINRALTDILARYPEALLFGEDVSQKGGVYTVTKGLRKKFGGSRVFNTLLDEQTILGLAQGYANLGLLPIPEIQYLAYYHNACDQIRGEACSLQYFSNGQFANPMVLRIASLGYQKGFGGHFHNDNSIAALRDIPGLVIGCPSRGDDAALMLKTLTALARVDGRVCALLEPIALYMTKDLHEVGDNEWTFAYPQPDQFLPLGESRIYHAFADELLIISYGNGIPMSLQVSRRLEKELGVKCRIMDLRWLLPLNEKQILEQASQCQRVLMVDEGRRSGGISESILALLAEQLPKPRPMSRVVGLDTYTPLGAAAGMVLPSTQDIYDQARRLVEREV